jgi:hypothetical protein
MPTNENTADFRVVMGKLKDQSFSNPQEMAEAFAEAMLIKQVLPTPDAALPVTSNRTTKATESFAVPNGQSYVDCGKDVSAASPVLVTTDDPPTIGILAVSGTKVYLTGPAPNPNYSVRATFITIS